MTMTPFTCERFADHLADYLEHDAAPAVAVAMDAHAAECADCRALRTDLEAIRSGAAMLPELAPSHDLWAGVAERIEAPVVPLNVTGSGRRAAATVGGAIAAPAAARRQDGRARRWWAHPALAAAALVGITAGVTYTATRGAMQSSTTTTTTVAATTPVVGVEGTTMSPRVEGTTVDGNAPEQQVAAAPSVSGPAVRGQVAPDARRQTPAAMMAAYRPGELGALDSLYFREIVRLRQVLTDRRGQLDSTTVEVLDRNMLVIDRAIQECREALAADPASRFLNEQLNEALETKIELLRTAATMAVGE